MVKLKARDLMTMDKDALWAIPDGDLVVVFDDGEVKTTSRRTIYSAYLWSIHRIYPKTPMLMRHHMGMSRISGGTHTKLLGVIYKDCVRTYQQSGVDLDLEAIWKLMYQTVNEIYTDFIQRLDAYVATMSALDFIEILDHPVIKEANHNVRPTQQSIDETYDLIEQTLRKDPALNDNAIAEAVRSSLVSMSQVNQCVGPRGYVTEIDSTIFRTPITVGYAHGMRRLYDTMIESRSASKALMFAKDPLAECEYFNRRLQLLAQVVERLAPGDCGTNHYMSWEVQPGELAALDGIHYVENGEIKTIHSDDHHLVGRVLNLRTPFGCQHSDRQTVCATCFGDISYSIPTGTVLGHVSAIAIGEIVTQLVLSTKHLDASSVIDVIDLGEFYSKYLVTGSEGNTLRLSPQLKNVPVKIVLGAEAAKSLIDVKRIQNFEELNVARITEMSGVTMLVGSEDNGGVHEMAVPVSMGSRLGSLSGAALKYIKEHGTTLDERGNYVIDLCDWENTASLFVLPLKHINMFDYMVTIASVILSAGGKQSLASCETTAEAIKMLMGLINTKLTVNLAHIMTMAYATTALDPKGGDYRLPRGGESFSFANYGDLMFYRSLGAAMAYQDQAKPFLQPDTYVLRNRPRHPMDALLMGN